MNEWSPNWRGYRKYNKTKFKVIKSKSNSGKGSALKLGVKKAKYDWILTTDIDMSVSLFQIYSWIGKKLVNKKHSVYFGSRTHKKSIVERNFFRKILGDIGSFLILAILVLSNFLLFAADKKEKEIKTFDFDSADITGNKTKPAVLHLKFHSSKILNSLM